MNNYKPHPCEINILSTENTIIILQAHFLIETPALISLVDLLPIISSINFGSKPYPYVITLT